MRRAVARAAVALALCAVGPARAEEPPACPEATAPKEVRTALGLERWCERSGPPAVRHGPYLVLHPDGRPLLRGQYRDGAAAGKWQSWHPGGAQSGEAEFRDGRTTGMLLGWYENGRGSFVGGFRDGVATGRIELFDAEGRLREAWDYDGAGVEVGHQAWDESGRALDPKSPEASRAGRAARQTSPLIDYGLTASSVARR